MRILHQLLRSTLNTLHVLAAAVSATFKSRAALQLENLALGHQLGVLQRSLKRPKLAPPDRLLWVWLCAVWSGWRSALIIVKPNSVIAWHRKSFRLFWKVRRGRPGRPGVPKNVRERIRRLSRENPLWGAPRIHGERLQFGIDVGETSVGKCASSEGWHVQWEIVPPGEESGPRSLSCIRGGNEADEAD